MTVRRGPAAAGIARFSRVVADLVRAEAFYCEGLGFRPVPDASCGPDLPALLGLPGTEVTQRVLRLGAEEVALVHLDPPGPAYPAGSHWNRSPAQARLDGLLGAHLCATGLRLPADVGGGKRQNWW